MELKPEIIERVKLLDEKYAALGQDLVSYLDGLLYADYVTYWDYIHLDTLLSLQNPLTPFPDEEIFIMYHQITELYFKLCLHEFRQISENANQNATFLTARLKRINNYFKNLTHSFDIMIEGMEQEQFLKFRMSLLPASGFQSAQYRMVEICSTDFIQLVSKDVREKYRNEKSTIEEMFEHLYWKTGATELATGKKTLTLKQFEKKYSTSLIELATAFKNKNVWAVYKSLPKTEQENQLLINEMKWLDTNINVNWPLVHYKSAVRYMQRKPEDIAATGGTNWQKYLPPRFQKRVFYPELWTESEIEEWGKSFIEQMIKA